MSEHYEAPQVEKKWSKLWEEEKIYAWDKNRKREETYAVDTPPPTVSGSLHLGHFFSYTQTDLMVRFHRQRGMNTFYPMGWDDNGLPTERRVQNVFGVRCELNLPYDPHWKATRDGGDKTENISRKNFIELCSTLTKEDEEVFKNLFQRLGLSVDWSLEYATIDSWCRKISQLSFLDLVKKGEAYTMKAPTLWDVTFQTAVAQAEVEDRELGGFFHDIRFQVEGGGEFVISTTRPELLAACVAVVAHPDDERFKHLFGKFCLTPLFHARVPILAADHADPTKGSGILMVCTFGDTMDIEWWKKQASFPLKQIIGRNGRLLPVVFGEAPFHSLNPEEANKHFANLAGLNVNQAQKKMVELLIASSALVGTPKPTTRAVKYYEKGDRPLEFISTRQWFVRILDHKEALLEQGEKIQWVPTHMKARYLDWVRNLNQDWCISRQRYFGVPFPVWYRLDGNGETLYGEPLFPPAQSLPIDPMVDVPQGFSENQRNQPGGFTGERDVMDTWATSSMTPQIVSGWVENEKRHQSLFPLDLRPQSHEIIRTWAFYTIVKAYLHERKIPWNTIAISGWILDPDRKKMSKSKGNVVTPEKYLDQYGGDAVRYWSSRARLGVDTAFDENLFKMGRKLTNKIFNASKFVLSQIQRNPQAEKDIAGTLLGKGITEPIDMAWVERMKSLIQRATRSFEQNDYATALQTTEETFWNFCDHYLELVKTRSYLSEGAPSESALRTLDWSLMTFLRLFAPFFPYLTEEIWSWRYRQDSGSIHVGTWPTEKELEKVSVGEGELLLKLAVEGLSQIRSFKTKNQKKLKWPVEKVDITVSSQHRPSLEKILGDLLLAGNVQPGGAQVSAGEVPDTELLRMAIILAESE